MKNRLYIALCAALWLVLGTGCSCGTGSRSTEAAADSVLVPESPQTILETPVAFSAGSLTEYAERIQHPDPAAPPFTEADFARMTVLAQSAVDKLQQELDLLQANDDPPDTYNVLAYLSGTQWVHNMRVVLEFLDSAPLPPAIRARLMQVLRNRDVTAAQLRQLEDAQLHGRRLLTL